MAATLTALERETIRVAWSAVRHINGLLQQFVRGFGGIPDEDLQGDAEFLALLLLGGGCPCHLPCCQASHRLPGHHSAEDGEFGEFVRSAVRGTYGGDELRAGSLSQSMLYRC